MALTKLTTDVENIQALSNKPNETEGLTADQLKEKFDKSATDIKTFINDTLTVEVDAIGTGLATLELAASNGWIPVNETWTYASATTITVPSGAASKYKKGDKIRYKQGGGYKYEYVITVTDTLLTVTGGSDYTVANATITDIYYSHELNPIGFPESFNWTPTAGGITKGNGVTVSTFNIIGNVVNFYVAFTLGSTSAITGRNSYTLPVSASIPATALGYILDSGAAEYISYSYVSDGTVYVDVLSADGTYLIFGYFSSTVPMTWTTNDLYKVSGSYQF